MGRTDTETFNVFNNLRPKDGYNNGNQIPYLLSNLKRVVYSAQAQNRIKAGEALGYYGHTARELGPLEVKEQQVVEVNGKPVVMRNEPVCVTKSLDIDDKGNVTHTQEFLDTTAGKAADALHAKGYGGFSWALSCGETTKEAEAFYGCDYVFRPSMLSKEKGRRMGMILESVQQPESDERQSALSALTDAGFEQADAESWLAVGTDTSSLNAMDLHAQLSERKILESAMFSQISTLEAQLAEAQQFKEDALAQTQEALASLPLRLSPEKEQKILEGATAPLAELVRALGDPGLPFSYPNLGAPEIIQANVEKRNQSAPSFDMSKY